jgi:hypothetical protein
VQVCLKLHSVLARCIADCHASSADTLNDIAAKVGAGCGATGDPGAFNSSDFALVREVMCLKE